MSNPIDVKKHPLLAPLANAIDRDRAFIVMKKHGCYVVPLMDGQRWRLRDRNGHDFPLGWLLEQPNGGYFETPEAALCAAGDHLDQQAPSPE